MRTYNLLFKMPENKELFIAAWAAISAYDLKVRTAGFPVQVTIIAKDDWLTNLLIPPMMFVTDKIEETEGMPFDLAIDFSDDRIISLAPYGKKAASICGAFLGIDEYVNELVSIRESKKSEIDILILPWSDESENLAYKVASRFPDLVVRNAYEGNYEFELKVILNSKVIVGYRSVETYLAASANRIVLEGYDLKTYDRNFLTKWSNHRYKMICVENKEDLDKNLPLLWRALEGIINGLQRQSRAESITNQS